MSTQLNIPITETWDRNTWANWDTYLNITSASAMGRVGTTVLPWGLNTQNHIDVATFLEAGWSGTGATFGHITSLNHWPGCTWNVVPGTNTLLFAPSEPIDITGVPGSNQSVVLALPEWPGGTEILLPNSSIQFSSDGFVSEIDVLPFSSSSQDVTDAGNTYVQFPLAFLDNGVVDMTKINGIRIVISTTTALTLFLLDLRVIGQYWVPSNVDYDNSLDVLRQCIPLDGWPGDKTTQANQLMPITWRSDAITTPADPRPVNASIAYVLNTGSMTLNNQFTLYMREQTSAYITQLNLEGTLQSQLTGLPQPTGGVAEFVPRTMAEFDVLDMETLNGQTMLALERVNDPQFQRFTGFTLNWGPSVSINIFGSANPSGGYTYGGDTAPVLQPQTNYVILNDLNETFARLRIYEQTDDGMLGALIFDTMEIADTFTFVRLPGRVGFQAFLADGDTYIQSIRPYSLTFAEFQSVPLSSITPVSGARLYAQFTPSVQLWQSWQPIADADDNVPYIIQDQNRALTIESTAITINTPSTTTPPQGVQTNPLTPVDDPISGITDFDNLTITFSIWFPANALSPTLDGNPPLTAQLVGEDGGIIPLTVPTLIGNQWQDVDLTLPQGVYPSGIYILQFFYFGTQPVKFWLDNIQIAQRSMAWFGRSVVSDPWNSNFAPWTPFHDVVNSDVSGIRFTTIGNNLQILGQALRQDAVIYSPIRTVPAYAQLGRLVFPEELVVRSHVGPEANIVLTVDSSTSDEATVTFDATGSQPGAYPIISSQWAFGDGQYGLGAIVTHTFVAAGFQPSTFFVNLIVTDSVGNVSTASAEVEA